MSLFSVIEKMYSKAPQKTRQTEGFSLIELIIVVLVISIISAIAIPNLLKARRSANEASAVASVRLITRSEVVFHLSNKRYATIDELYNANHLDQTLGVSPYSKSGYTFSVVVFPPTETVDAKYNLQANPAIHSLDNQITGTGSKNFGSCEAGVIYQTYDNTPVVFDIDTRLPQDEAYVFGQ